MLLAVFAVEDVEDALVFSRHEPAGLDQRHSERRCRRSRPNAGNRRLALPPTPQAYIGDRLPLWGLYWYGRQGCKRGRPGVATVTVHAIISGPSVDCEDSLSTWLEE